MAGDQGKKINIIHILKILQKYTDADHTMTQQQIVDKLLEDYGMSVTRSAVKRNISELIEAGYDIQFKEIKRSHTNKKTDETEENYIFTDLYFEHDFTEAELHMLIDGLLFSRSVPYTQRKQLIDKLGKLSSIHFNKRMNHVHCMSADSPQNPELFHTIDVLDEAIAEGKQVRITYNYYYTDLKLHPNLAEDGTIKRQVLNPYQMIANEGRYYLICNNDHHDNASNYRIDRITNIELLDTPVKPKSQVKGLENGLNLQEYVYQNINMFGGEVGEVEFETTKKNVSLVVDFFGKSVWYQEKEDGTVACRVKASLESMKRWAVMYASSIKVISPASLVADIRQELEDASRKYSG